jgi:hypothetical protein
MVVLFLKIYCGVMLNYGCQLAPRAAKDAAQHTTNDLVADFASDGAGGASDHLLACGGAAFAHAAAKNGTKAVEQATASRCSNVAAWRG